MHSLLFSFIMNEKEHLNAIIKRYLRAYIELDKRLDDEKIKKLRMEDRTFSLIEVMAASICKTQAKSARITRRFRESTETREAFCFIAYLYFDYGSQVLADRFKIGRQPIHHYCKNVIAKYQVYPDFRENMLKFFSEEDMNEMINKFDNKKRKRHDKTSRKKRQVSQMC